MTPLGRACVRKAEEDRRTLLQLRSCRPKVHSSICFRCQQMTEKYLKALVHERGLTVPRTHDFGALVDLLAPTDSTVVRHRRAAAGLNRFAVGPRYPRPFLVAGASDSRTAWNAAERIRAEVRRRLGLRRRARPVGRRSVGLTGWGVPRRAGAAMLAGFTRCSPAADASPGEPNRPTRGRGRNRR
jgi:HEPN domain-containing protein